ncbi:uncharacterized protein LOC128737776 [Sabethes cyaneus]|uniref:uncharacterized protein LOC128737776 n=1 Tax=Sabethes cyaneus TaxID=53552 RepID=UPI00237E380B|nr:uncharacterized protein LOC128737776 [Sabethes cyaneus]
MDNINALPIEVLEHIFNYLSVKTWNTCCLVCSLWYNILRGTQFQRRYCLSMNRTFEEPLPEAERRIFPIFHNIALVQWVDNDDDDDDDDDEEDEVSRQFWFAEHPHESDEPFSLRYLFEPKPESNIHELLFRLELDFESLELCIPFDSYRDIVGNSLRQIKNLREFILKLCRDPTHPSNRNRWVIEHDRIETLSIDLTVTKVEFSAILPNLKTLALLTDCGWGFQIIEKHCAQLQSLEVQFQDAETMDKMLSLTFSNLTNLQVQLCHDRALQEHYKLTRNNLADKETEEKFIREMPKLKKLFVESNLLMYRIAGPLSRFAHHLEELTLECQQIDFPQLKAIETIPNLKIFRLLYSRVASTRTLPMLNMPLLKKLSLLNNESHVTFNGGLCNLKSLKVTFWTRNSYKALHKICQNLPKLERLELLVYSKLGNTAFRELHKLTKLVSLRIKNCQLKSIHWSHCSISSNVRRIEFTDCRLDLHMLLKILTLFPGLRELFVDSSNVAYTDAYDSSDDARYHCLQQLRALLPNCAISLPKSSFIQD